MKSLKQRLFINASRAGILIGFAGMASSQAYAQTQPDQEQPPSVASIGPQVDASTEKADIVVTGSRIARRDFSSNSPILTMNEAALQSQGSVEVEQKLQSLPQFTPGATAFQTSLQASNVGQPTLNLRGLGASRNLVLIDGRRAQPSSPSLQIDTNSIPAALVDNVEVITGGASAVYGSDAISGVINFKLKRDFNGVIASGQAGVTELGDGATYNLELTAGKTFADGRGSIMLSGGYYGRNSVTINSRDYFARARAAGLGGSNALPEGVYQPTLAGPIGPKDFVPPNFLPGGNLPTALALSTLFNGKYGVTGVVTPNTNIGFNADGTLYTQNNGVKNYRGPGIDAGYFLDVNGQLVFTNDQSSNTLLTTPLTRYNAFARAEYEFSDSLTVMAQGMFTKYDTNVQQNGVPAAFNVWNLVLPVTNPFVPADLKSLLQSRPQAGANFGLIKSLEAFGPRAQRFNTELYQLLLSVSGKLPGIDGSWEIYGTHGSTKIDETTYSGAVSYRRLEQLLFAPDGGNSLCTGGFNPFGNNPLSAECVAFASREAPKDSQITQNVVEANLQGRFFTLPAGDVRFAAGAGYREIKYQMHNDPVLSTTGTSDFISLSASQPSTGSINVKEIYGELLVPILKNVPGIKELTISPAFRYSDYSSSGGVSTYKVDFNWTLIDVVRLRGGYQRAIRAPNIAELSRGAVANPPFIGFTALGQGDPCDIASTFRQATNPGRAQVRQLCITQGVPAATVDSFSFPVPQVGGTTVSNSALVPETADTYTVGAVFRPGPGSGIFSRLSFSIDYYNIAIKDAINYIPATTALRNCFNEIGANPTFDQNSVFCQAITRSAGGQIINLATRPVNSGGFKTDGIDFQLDWGIGLRNGSLLANVAGTYVNSFKIASLSNLPFLEFAGTQGGPLGSVPRWKVNSTLAYATDSATIGVRWNYLDGMRSATSVTSPTSLRPGVSSYSTFDVFGRINVTKAFEMRAGVTNLANKQPLDVDGFAGQTDPSLYDPLGRRFYVGFTARY